MGMGYSSENPPDLSSPIAELVRECIYNNEIVIFSKSYCPYCKMAKDVFDKLGCEYKVIELNMRKDGDQIQSILELMTGARTVPRVFVGGQFIGGGNDVKRLYEDGSLQIMLRKPVPAAEEPGDEQELPETEEDSRRIDIGSVADALEGNEAGGSAGGSGRGGNRRGHTGEGGEVPPQKFPRRN